MARPTLRHHRKFRHLARLMQGDVARAWGTLELIWHVAYECGDARIGTSADVETLACWRGKKGACVAALVAAGFLDFDAETEEYAVHDLDDHAPDYVRKRRQREDKRRTNGGQTADSDRTNGRTPTRAPTPTRSPAPARTPSGGTTDDEQETPPAQPETDRRAEPRTVVLGDDVWQLWREVAAAHGEDIRLGASQTQGQHCVALGAAYGLSELRAALEAWWASPHTGGRNLGLFVSQVAEVHAHVQAKRSYTFRAPPHVAEAAEAEAKVKAWVPRVRGGRA